MRTSRRRASALITIVGLAAAACTGGASPSASPSVAAPSASPSAAASASASPSADACATDSLETKTAGTFTIGADNPAYPPYFAPREGGNTEPWDPAQGDPTSGEGFESAVGYAVAEELGFGEDAVTWIPVPFNNSFAPGPKEFDVYITQVSYSPAREEAADLSDGYYFGNQAVVVLKDGPYADATTITELKPAKLGAQAGTTSFAAIEEVIQPTAEASAYDSNDAAIEALKATQIDGILVDLPTAFFITNVQAPETAVIGQIGPEEGAEQEYFSMVLEKGSPLTECVNAAIRTLADDGTLESLIDEWLPDSTVPFLEP
jgi:polar amino acid transport system substrate-binding protein